MLIGRSEEFYYGGSIVGDHSDCIEDLEDMYSTELDEEFSVATAFVVAIAVDKAAQKASNELQLQLYVLYKIEIEGLCIAPQPSVLKLSAHAYGDLFSALNKMVFFFFFFFFKLMQIRRLSRFNRN